MTRDFLKWGWKHEIRYIIFSTWMSVSPDMSAMDLNRRWVLFESRHAGTTFGCLHVPSIFTFVILFIRVLCFPFSVISSARIGLGMQRFQWKVPHSHILGSPHCVQFSNLGWCLYCEHKVQSLSDTCLLMSVLDYQLCHILKFKYMCPIQKSDRRTPTS